MQPMKNSILVNAFLVNTTWTTNWNTWMLKSWSLVYRFCIYRYWFVDIISVYNFNLVSKKVFHWSQNGRLKIFPPSRAVKTKHGSNQRLRVGFVSCLLSNRFPLWSSCPAFCLNHKTSVFRPPRRHLTEPGFTQALRCLSTFRSLPCSCMERAQLVFPQQTQQELSPLCFLATFHHLCQHASHRRRLGFILESLVIYFI